MAQFGWILVMCFCFAAGVTSRRTLEELEEELLKRRVDQQVANKLVKTRKESQREESSSTCPDCVTREEFEALEADLIAATNMISLLNSEVVQLSSSLETLTTEVAAHDGDIAALETDVTVLVAANQVVGFTAYSNSNFGTSANVVVRFPSVNSNTGGGYDTSTGMFTCPVTGLYHFSVTMMTKSHLSILQLVKENVALTGAYADDDNYDQGSNSWVVACSAGERVWCVENRSSATIYAHFDSYPGILNSFTGFLIGVM